MDRIDECRAILILEYGFTATEALCATTDQHHKGRPDKMEFTASQIDYLRRNNEKDTEIYNAAVHALDARIASHGTMFWATFEAVKTFQKALQNECPKSPSSNFDERLHSFHAQFECMQQRTHLLAQSLEPSFPKGIPTRRH